MGGPQLWTTSLRWWRHMQPLLEDASRSTDPPRRVRCLLEKFVVVALRSLTLAARQDASAFGKQQQPTHALQIAVAYHTPISSLHACPCRGSSVAAILQAWAQGCEQGEAVGA